MEFVVDKGVLLDAARETAKIAPTHSPVELLRCAYLETDSDVGILKLYATNYVSSICIRIKADIVSDGNMTIPAGLLLEITSRLRDKPESDIRFSADSKGNIQVACGSCSYLLACMGVGYPKPSFELPVETAEISGAKLAVLTKKSAFAAGVKTDKETLKGINLSLKDNTLTATASDGFCLVQTSDIAESKAAFSVIVPAVQFSQLAGIAGGYERFQVGCTQNSVIFHREDISFSIRPIAGTYMNTQFMTSMPVEYRATAYAHQLETAVSNSSILSGEPVNIAIRANDILIKSKSDMGNVKGSIPAVDTVPTGKSGFFFSSGNLTAALANMTGMVTLSISKQGHLLLRDEKSIYFQTGVREPKAKKKVPKRKKAETESEAA